MNRWTGIGRLTKDPELIFSPGSGTAVTTFTLAVNRRFAKEGQPQADFINIKVFGKMAEAVANYKKKGEQVGIAGRLSINNYEKDGQKLYFTEIIAEEIEFIGKGQANNQESNSNHEPSYNSDVTPIQDDDIPF